MAKPFEPDGSSFRLSTRRGKQFNSMIQREIDPLTGADREAVLISASDANRLGLVEQQLVRLRSDHGMFEGRIRRSPIKPGNLEVHWPEGNRCCVSVVIDLSPARGPQGIGEADLSNPMTQFGMHDGLDQLLTVLGRFNVKATFAVPAVIARLHPERLRALLAAGHEIAANGLKHEAVSGLSREDEKERLDLATRILTDVTGQRPAGWMATCVECQRDVTAAARETRAAARCAFFFRALEAARCQRFVGIGSGGSPRRGFICRSGSLLRE